METIAAVAPSTSTSTRNACKLCAPLGASVVFKGIKNCLPVIHGAQGCATYIRRYMISHYKEPIDIASTNFSEATTIFGGRKNLNAAIENIIREEVEMIGTIRTLDPDMQREIHERIRRTVTHIAEASGATAEVEIEKGYPVTYNDPELTSKMGKTMQAVAGVDNVVLTRARTGAEDFSFYAEEIPGLFVFLGGMPADQDPSQAAPHHTPDFYIDESGLQLGVELYTNFALDYLLLTNE